MGSVAVCLLLVFVFADALEWFSARDLDQKTKSNLLAKNCFRGTYGIHQDLSLFNCPVEDVNVPFATLPQNSLLCVIEVRNRESVMNKLKLNQDHVSVVLEAKEEIIIGNVDLSSDSYPSLCSRSDFEGGAWNVIVVPMRPMSPPNPVEDQPEYDAPNPQISALLNNVSASQLSSYITTLSNYNTRLSTAADAVDAVNWAARQYESYGFTVTQQPFRSGYCNNIIARKQGTANTTVVIGSHIDCRAASLTNTTARAPGADDNGSGMAASLELARLISQQRLNLTSTLVLAAFCGEEQGLYGSQFMANDYKNKSTQIIGMYNADMIGYRCGNTITLTFDSRGVNTNLTNTCRSVVPDYLNTYSMGTNSGCCSDNQSFENAGYPTVSLFECPGTTVDNPNYHRNTDLPSTINSTQLVYFAKALYACALTQARPL